jgi:hypothetical protein
MWTFKFRLQWLFVFWFGIICTSSKLFSLKSSVWNCFSTTMLIIFDVNVETHYDIFKCNFSCYIYDNIMCLLEMTFFFHHVIILKLPPPPPWKKKTFSYLLLIQMIIIIILSHWHFPNHNGPCYKLGIIRKPLVSKGALFILFCNV